MASRSTKVSREGASVEDHLLRLLQVALSGGRPDIERYARTITKLIGEDHPVLATALRQTLHDAPSRSSPFKSDTIAAIPIDSDSRMQLLRYEHPVILEREPILDDALHSALNQIVIERMRMPELLKAGLSPTRSALFHGPPGVGKTLAARWIAKQLGLPLLVLDLASVMSSFLGRTGANIRNVLDYAKGVKCVLLLDELDAIAKRRDDIVEIGELKRLVTVLVQEIDSWPDTGLLISATNHPDLLDRAIWRRFDIVLQFEVPQARLIFDAISHTVPELRSNAKQLAVLASIYDGTAFSDIERDLKRLRRQSILSGRPIEDFIKPFVSERLRCQSRTRRIEIARNLVPRGLSQREIHDLTGVSRDTLRKTPLADK